MKRYLGYAKRPHQKYDELFAHPDEDFKEVLKELSSPERFEAGRMEQIAADTDIPFKMLESWRTKLRKNPDCMAKHGQGVQGSSRPKRKQ